MKKTKEARVTFSNSELRWLKVEAEKNIRTLSNQIRFVVQQAIEADRKALMERVRG